VRFRDEIGLTAVPEDVCVLAGVREMDPGEREAIEHSTIRCLTLAELAQAPLPAAPWYVHVDVDVLDPDGLPPLRFPVAGGPSVDVLAETLRALAARGTIAAFGLGCTFTPQGLAQPDPLATIRPLIDAAMGTARSA
jgi:arginase